MQFQTNGKETAMNEFETVVNDFRWYNRKTIEMLLVFLFSEYKIAPLAFRCQQRRINLQKCAVRCSAQKEKPNKTNRIYGRCTKYDSIYTDTHTRSVQGVPCIRGMQCLKTKTMTTTTNVTGHNCALIHKCDKKCLIAFHD